MMKKISHILWIVALVFSASCALTLSGVLLAWSVSLIALAGAFSAVESYRSSTLYFRKLDGLILVCAAYFLGRAFFSNVWDLAKEDVLLLVVGLITYWCFRSRSLQGIAMWTVLFFSLINGVWFVAQKLGIDFWVPLDCFSKAAQTSPDFGLFQDYGALGNAMAVGGMLLTCQALWSRGLRKRMRALILVIGFGAVVVALSSGSRSAAVSLVVAGGVLTLVSLRLASSLPRDKVRKARITCSALCFISLVLFGALGSQVFLERNQSKAGLEVLETSNIRTDYWGMAMEQFLSSPTVGAGARSFQYECFKNWPKGLSSMEANPEFAHSEYLQTLADYGWVGLMLLLIVVGAHYRKALASIYMSRAHRPFPWPVVAGLTGLTVVVVHAFTDFALHLPWNMLLGALSLVCCVPTAKRKVMRRVDKVFGVTQIAFCVLIGSFALVEVWAGAPLVGIQQVREDGAWNREIGEDQLGALELAEKRSSNFRRSQKIGTLYHAKFLEGDATAYEQALAAYETALERNPSCAEAVVNLAKLQYHAQKYEDAELKFLSAEGVSGSRDWWFSFYLDWARNEVERGRLAYADKKYSLAEKHLVRAIDLAGTGSSPSKPRQLLQRDCYVGRMRIAIETGDFERASELWSETKKEVKPWILSERKARVHRSLAEIYLEEGIEVWHSRKPALAKQLFEKARIFYLADRQIDKGIKNEERIKRMAYLDHSLSILKQAGY